MPFSGLLIECDISAMRACRLLSQNSGKITFFVGAEKSYMDKLFTKTNVAECLISKPRNLFHDWEIVPNVCSIAGNSDKMIINSKA